MEVRFDANIRLTVYKGEALIAEGTPDSMIVFTSNAANPAPGDWLWIRNHGNYYGSRFRHCVIEYATYGLYCYAYASGCGDGDNLSLIDSCEIRHNQYGIRVIGSGSSSSGCIPSYTGASSPTISWNWIHHNTFSGIYMAAFDGYYANGYIGATITRNVIEHNGQYGMWCLGTDPTSPRIYNNIVQHNALAGLRYRENFQTAYFRVQNNAFLYNATGILSDSALISTNFGYNDVWQNTTDYDGITAPASDISADPLFADTANHDYSIPCTSPCYNTGDPSTDLDPDGSLADIGVLWYDGSSLNTSLEDTVCDTSLPYAFGNLSIDSAGVYQQILPSAEGCDSIVTLTLMVNPTFQTADADVVCNSELPYSFGTQSLTASGTYVETFSSIEGCDSTVTLTLTVNPTFQVSDADAVCDSELPYTFGNQSLSASGTYVETFNSADGCDSTVTLTLTVNPTFQVSDADAVCDSELPYSFGTQSLTASGTYVETFSSIEGCDSIVTLTLTVNPTFIVFDTQSVCESALPYQFGSQQITVAGTYTEVFPSALGCDSLVTLTLDIIPTNLVSALATICDSELPYQFGTQTITASGNYQETFINSQGCDSLVTLIITVNPTYQVNNTRVICDAEAPFVFGSQLLSVSGIYTEAFLTAAGCDSTVTLDLTINPTPNQPVIEAIGGDTLSVAPGADLYVWHLNGSILPGVTTNWMTAQVSGPYTVKANTNGCTSPLSEAYQYVVTSLENKMEKPFFSLFPNPVSEKLFLRPTVPLPDVIMVEVYTAEGKLVKDISYPPFTSQLSVPTHELAEGPYWIRIQTRGGMTVKKFLKI